MAALNLTYCTYYTVHTSCRLMLIDTVCGVLLTPSSDTLSKDRHFLVLCLYESEYCIY